MKNFFRQLLSSNDNVSSKRLMALITFIVAIVIIFLKFSIDYVYTLLGFIAASMGFGTIDKQIFKNKDNTPLG